ncbi:hypothetical protein DFH09DRAFT_1306911 [Mycena vulgaris]|nr:hypothetical protein DFH09DRAFT_1306911 [Mycena vulgaris]
MGLIAGAVHRHRTAPTATSQIITLSSRKPSVPTSLPTRSRSQQLESREIESLSPLTPCESLPPLPETSSSPSPSPSPPAKIPPSPPHRRLLLDSSDSDSSPQCPTHHTMFAHATLDAPSGKPPVETLQLITVLHQGECDPAVIHNFELAVTNYATLKGLDTDKEIMEVSSEPFYIVVIAIQAQNSLLSGSPSHLTNDGLRSHLETTMCKDLMEDYDFDAVAKGEKTIVLWLAAVKHVDNKCHRDISRIHAAAAKECDRCERDRKRRPDDDGDPPLEEV